MPPSGETAPPIGALFCVFGVVGVELVPVSSTCSLSFLPLFARSLHTFWEALAVACFYVHSLHAMDTMAYSPVSVSIMPPGSLSPHFAPPSRKEKRRNQEIGEKAGGHRDIDSHGKGPNDHHIQSAVHSKKAALTT